jgi:hypothetical protein
MEVNAKEFTQKMSKLTVKKNRTTLRSQVDQNVTELKKMKKAVLMARD